MKVFLAIIIVFVVFLIKGRLQKEKKHKEETLIPTDEMDDDLTKHVSFYQHLNDAEKTLFRKRAQHFLDTTRITPVGNFELSHQDKLYVAASAIIPIFHFKDWAYNNLDEVLIYADTFTKDFSEEDAERNVLGMVGDGAMHRMMILSLPALRSGFEDNRAGNTGIHEFVHLLDKADGATDGVPQYMIPQELVQPWLKNMHQTINAIRSGHSDINPYAGTNEAEFLAVISEYFFQKPAFLEEHHPELYAILVKAYAIEQPVV